MKANVYIGHPKDFHAMDRVWKKWDRERAARAVHDRVLSLEREHWSREHDLTVYEMALADFVTQLEREADVG